MICKCGAEYHEDHGCGYAVGCGSSFAEHLITRHMNENGFFGDKPKYQPWESPANVGICPWCWHKKDLK